MSNAFYQKIIPAVSFDSLLYENNYHALPKDWFIIVTDIVNSTQAIESGHYKNVNTIGVSCIIAAVNCNKDIAIPYVFGGDGAFVAVPASMVDNVKKSLSTLIQMSSWQYKLKLRVGIFSVAKLYKEGLELGVAKFRTSENIVQASIKGDGWDYAEKAIKSTQDLPEILKEDKHMDSEIDLSGFECRWKNIRARNNYKICILILALGAKDIERSDVYRIAYEEILEIYGDSSQHHPVALSQLHFHKNPYKYLNEIKTKFVTKKQFLTKGYQVLFKTLLMTLVGSYLMKKNKKTEKVNWGEYKKDFILNADYQKFDGGLKLILDGSDNQHDRITNYLESQQQTGCLVYGTHLCKHALVTCYISSYEKNHIHFVDGSDGGYAIAAKMLKKNLAKKTN